MQIKLDLISMNIIVLNQYILLAIEGLSVKNSDVGFSAAQAE